MLEGNDQFKPHNLKCKVSETNIQNLAHNATERKILH